ncbi:MAG TPA: TonB family protein [Bryobacterales bacterium]|nr:TonB family protein [Bryobacterales bacterium]
MLTQAEPAEVEIHLLPDVWDDPAHERRRRAALTSALIHVVVIFFLVVEAKLFPSAKSTAPNRPERHVSLVFPAQELTQKEPNRGPRSKLFLGETTPPRPQRLVMPRAIPSAPPAPPSRGDLARLEKPPQLVPKPELSGTAPVPQLMPPGPPPPAPPKIVLEDADKSAGGHKGPQQPGLLAQQQPGNVIEGAVRDLSRSSARGGGMAVGDGYGAGPVDGYAIPSRPNAGSHLQLLSDPMGVDFRPYLTRILAAVRRNWYAVIPESARLGMIRGRVAIQFIIVRQGSVSKLVIADSSGMEALDRAAVAGISASNPFPPLPTEYRGSEVKLQFTFLYNIPVGK